MPGCAAPISAPMPPDVPRPALPGPMLQVEDLHVSYGRVAALHGVSLHVDPGSFVAVVGPNGAGKTSLLSAIAGVAPVQTGRIVLNGASLRGAPPEQIVRRGVALVPEGRHVFASMTVQENLMLGATVRPDRAAARAEMEQFLVTFPILGARRAQPAGRLSGGEQQQLAIARALLSRPRLLLLDEPSLGLAPAIIAQVYEHLADIRAHGVAVLVVEQNAGRVLRAADRIYVLSGGLVQLSGMAEEVLRDTTFEAAYFGTPLERPKVHQ
jgi:branched-chain amino acid transport system ATP-binding protein